MFEEIEKLVAESILKEMAHIEEAFPDSDDRWHTLKGYLEAATGMVSVAEETEYLEEMNAVARNWLDE